MSIKALGGLQLPSQKEWAAGLGGLIAFCVIALASYLHYPLSDETETLLVVVLPPLIAKLVPPSAQDVLTHVNDAIVQAGVIAGKLTPPEQLVAADPNNTLVLKPAQLVQLGPQPSLVVPSKAPLTPAFTPQRMVDPAVVLQPKIEPAPPTPPIQHYDPT